MRLIGLRPPIWRVLWLASSTRLPAFNLVLQVAMGWSNIHLHRFELGDIRYGVPDAGFPDQTRSEAAYRLDDLLGEAGDSLVYRYDLGSDWAHAVRLEKVLPFDERLSLPLCLRGRRACPLEEIGGTRDYKGFLNAISDTSHPRYATLQAWLGADFDPERFDLERINQALETYCQ